MRASFRPSRTPRTRSLGFGAGCFPAITPGSMTYQAGIAAGTGQGAGRGPAATSFSLTVAGLGSAAGRAGWSDHDALIGGAGHS